MIMSGVFKLVPSWPLGRRPDQGGLQPVGGGHDYRAQDPLCHSQQDERLHRQRRPRRFYTTDETVARGAKTVDDL